MQKPTIGNQARLQAAPYTPPITSSSTAVSTVIPPSPTQTILPSVNCLPSHRLEPSTSAQSSCHCSSTSTVQQTRSIAFNRPSTNIANPTTILSQTDRRTTLIRRPINSTAISTNSTATSTNPMLLVPFAAVPGFIPIQQGQQTPNNIGTNMTSRPPAHLSSVQSSNLSMYPNVYNSHQTHANQMITGAQQTTGNCNIAGNGSSVGAANAVLLTPTPCNNSNVKVIDFDRRFFIFLCIFLG